MKNNKNYNITIVGLGYVGLPLAIEFSKKYKTVGFDIDHKRVGELNLAIDHTNECDEAVLKKQLQSNLKITDNLSEIKNSNIYIITVPTPVTNDNIPNLNPLIKSCESVGKYLKVDDIVIFESTVYPGCTEEVCVPILEKKSKLNFNSDFYCGYSPERINPGDKERTLTKIVKITSGSTKKSSNIIDKLYSSIIKAGTFKADSIKIAEAAKVIENSQRDINIAFVNELSKIFNILEIDTLKVLEAASTKWNFLNFKPGLVGGHCIGVDPYYLAQKSQEVGYHPEIILAGRRINDSMGKHVVIDFLKLMIQKELKIKNSKVLLLGITFKENCPDIRNTKVVDIYTELNNFNISVDVYDPHADLNNVKDEYDIKLKQKLEYNNHYDGVILAVAHNEFKKIKIKKLLKSNNVVYDLKGFFDEKYVDKRL